VIESVITAGLPTCTYLSNCGYRNMEFKTYHRYMSFGVTILSGNIFHWSLHIGYDDVLTVLNCITVLPLDCAQIKWVPLFIECAA